VVAYEPFLFLLGAVFVPLAGVFLVAYYLLPRGAWDVSETAPARPALLLPWAAGFVAYQLTTPTFFLTVGAGWTGWWTARQADLGIPTGHGLSASLVSLTVATLLTVAVALPGALRARRT
jgi:purine-cytosine permease-like protein